MSEWQTLAPGLKYLFVKPQAISKRQPACRIQFDGKVYEAVEVQWEGAGCLRECSQQEARARICVVTSDPVRYRT